MPKTIKKQIIPGGYVTSMELTTWGNKIGTDYVKKFEDLVYVAFFDNLYGIFPLSEYRAGKFAFLYNEEVGKATTWLFDDNTSLNCYEEDEQTESDFDDYSYISSDEYDSDGYDNVCKDCREKEAKQRKENKNTRIDNGDDLKEYLEEVERKLKKCDISFDIELKKISILDFNIPEHKYEKTELKECNYPYYFEVKLQFPKLMDKYNEIINEEEKKIKNINEQSKNFPTGTVFRFKDNPSVKYKSIGWAESGVHIVLVPENLTTLEEMDGHFSLIHISDLNTGQNAEKL